MRYLDYFNLHKALSTSLEYPTIKSEYIFSKNKDILTSYVSTMIEIEKKLFTETIINFEKMKQDKSNTQQDLLNYYNDHKSELEFFSKKKAEFDRFINSESQDPPNLLKFSIEDLPDNLSDEQSEALFLFID